MKTERPLKQIPRATEPATDPMSGETPALEPAPEPTPSAPTSPVVGIPGLTMSAVMHLSPAPEPAVEVAATPAMSELEQKRAEAAQNAPQGTRGAHPYEYQIADRIAVPAAFRDPEYNIDRARIDAHLQDAWEHERTPVIAGVMIGERT